MLNQQFKVTGCLFGVYLHLVQAYGQLSRWYSVVKFASYHRFKIRPDALPQVIDNGDFNIGGQNNVALNAGLRIGRIWMQSK